MMRELLKFESNGITYVAEIDDAAFSYLSCNCTLSIHKDKSDEANKEGRYIVSHLDFKNASEVIAMINDFENVKILDAGDLLDRHYDAFTKLDKENKLKTNEWRIYKFMKKKKQKEKRETIMRRVKYMMPDFFGFCATMLLAIILLIAGCFINAIPVYFLWNWLMPDLFNISEITFLQSVGIMLLCSLLFKNTSSSSKQHSD